MHDELQLKVKSMKSKVLQIKKNLQPGIIYQPLQSLSKNYPNMCFYKRIMPDFQMRKPKLKIDMISKISLYCLQFAREAGWKPASHNPSAIINHRKERTIEYTSKTSQLTCAIYRGDDQISAYQFPKIILVQRFFSRGGSSLWYISKTH